MALPFIAPRSDATTFLRRSLAELTRMNDLVIRGTVLDRQSHWAPDGTIIVTDIRILPLEVLKGEAPDPVTVTVLGGVVGDLATLEFGGPLLEPGSEYVLFLSRRPLPGVGPSLTTPDLAQGVFDVTTHSDEREPRARSQASGETMVPDSNGETTAPGGVGGLPLAELRDEIRTAAARR
jgi:hypothetical protein